MYCMQQMLVVGSTLPIELSLGGLVHRSCSAAAEFFWPAGNNPSCTVRIFTGWIRKPEPKNAGTSRVLGWCALCSCQTHIRLFCSPLFVRGSSWARELCCALRSLTDTCQAFEVFGATYALAEAGDLCLEGSCCTASPGLVQRIRWAGCCRRIVLASAGKVGAVLGCPGLCCYLSLSTVCHWAASVLRSPAGAF